MKRKITILIGIPLFLIGSILIYWNILYYPYKASFTKKMETKADNITETGEVCTAEEISNLPEPLQRYCKYIGLKNFPKHQVTHTVFNNTKFIFDTQSGKILNMDYDLWLFSDIHLDLPTVHHLCMVFRLMEWITVLRTNEVE